MILTEHYEEAILELALKDAVCDICMHNSKAIEFFEEYLCQLENNKLTDIFEENFAEIINEEFYSNLEKYSGVLMEGRIWDTLTKKRSLGIPGLNSNLQTGKLNKPKEPTRSIRDWARDVPYRAGSAIRSGIDKANSMYARSNEAGTNFYSNNRARLVNAKNNFMAGYNRQPKSNAIQNHPSQSYFDTLQKAKTIRDNYPILNKTIVK